MGRPVTHFEIGARDLGTATDFYKELFGWEVELEPMPEYRLLRTAEGSVRGGLLKLPDGAEPYVTIYVGVEELGATLESAEALGAKVIVEPMGIPGGAGAFAMFQDPEGVMIGIFEERDPR